MAKTDLSAEIRRFPVRPQQRDEAAMLAEQAIGAARGDLDHALHMLTEAAKIVRATIYYTG
jgi:hypothetical protein